MATPSETEEEPVPVKVKLPPKMVTSFDDVRLVQKVPTKTAGADAGRGVERGVGWLVVDCLANICATFMCLEIQELGLGRMLRRRNEVDVEGDTDPER